MFMKTYPHIPRTDLDFKYYEENGEEFETIWIEIPSENSPNVIIASIYRHPTKDNEKLLFNFKKF